MKKTKYYSFFGLSLLLSISAFAQTSGTHFQDGNFSVDDIKSFVSVASELEKNSGALGEKQNDNTCLQFLESMAGTTQPRCSLNEKIYNEYNYKMIDGWKEIYIYTQTPTTFEDRVLSISFVSSGYQGYYGAGFRYLGYKDGLCYLRFIVGHYKRINIIAISPAVNAANIFFGLQLSMEYSNITKGEKKIGRSKFYRMND